MANVKQLVDAKIAGKKVMVFSKTYCPYCKMAKQALQNYVGNELSADDYEVMEIDTRRDTNQIQDYLGKLTGARSVPRVFINRKFIGGGEETVSMHNNGVLKQLLSQ